MGFIFNDGEVLAFSNDIIGSRIKLSKVGLAFRLTHTMSFAFTHQSYLILPSFLVGTTHGFRFACFQLFLSFSQMVEVGNLQGINSLLS
jgi:hypothetical protein